MKKILLGFSLLLIIFTFNACVKNSIVANTNQQTSPRVTAVTTTPVPNPVQIPTRTIVKTPVTNAESYRVKTIQGNILTIQAKRTGFVFPQYQNKIILLQIFGQDCPYCFKEIPIINRIKQRYAQNLQVIAMQAQDPMSKQTASRLIQQFQMNYPIIDKNEAIDLLRFMQKNYEWRSVLPYILLIKNGVTEYSFSGEVSQQELDEAVRSLI